MKSARIFFSALPALALAQAILLLAACNLSPGGGTDVGNPEFSARVTGSIVHKDGSPAPFVRIHLRSREFLPQPDSLTALNGKAIQDGATDTQGFFTFDSVPKGEYRIEAVDTPAHGAVVSVSADGRSEHLTAAPIILDTTGWITGKLKYVGPPLVGNSNIFIAVYGMNRWTAATTGGDFTLSDLPPGTYSLRVYAASNPAISAIVTNVQLTAGGRTVVDTVNLSP
jgi:hypothetical protein